MESSHITGDDGGERCNSSESGWTMYLASPMQGDDDDDGGKGSGSEGSNVDDGYCYTYINGRRGGKDQYQDDGDDDDSLASDASTGPAKVKVPPMPDAKEDEGHRTREGGGGGENGKEDEKEDDMHTKFSTSSRKKASKAEKGGEGKLSKRGYSKRGSTSRTSFFW